MVRSGLFSHVGLVESIGNWSDARAASSGWVDSVKLAVFETPSAATLKVPRAPGPKAATERAKAERMY